MFLLEMGLHCDLNSLFKVNEIEAMNKYMEQNWRIENIFFFLIPSQHFLNVTVTGNGRHCTNTCYAKKETQALLLQGVSATCSYTHGGQIWLPTITEC